METEVGFRTGRRVELALIGQGRCVIRKQRIVKSERIEAGSYMRKHL